MRQWFFFLMFASVPATILAWLLYSFGKYVYTLFDERRELTNLDAIQADAAARREQKRAQNAQRLNNGCQHVFGSGIGFPPDTCAKCGLEAEKPAGACDHVWRRVDSPTPASACEKCGKTHRVEW